jgi:hypothetical protein
MNARATATLATQPPSLIQIDRNSDKACGLPEAAPAARHAGSHANID